MAKPIQPEGLDRRQLLASAAGIAVSSIVPTTKSAQAADPAKVIDVASRPARDRSALNVCAITARRIEEIAERNRIRTEAGLPLLSITKEIRRMKEVADAADFEAFAAIHRSAVWDEVLAPVRKARGEPKWWPRSWIEGLWYQAQVSRILRERFRMIVPDAGVTPGSL